MTVVKHFLKQGAPLNRSGVLIGLLGLAIAVIAYADARSFPLQNLENGLGAAFFPLLIIVALAVVSGFILVLSALGRGAQHELDFRGEGTWAAGGLLVALILFWLAFSIFGLLMPSIVFIAGAAWLFGAPLLHSVLFGIAGGGVVHVLFVNILNVHLI